MRVVRHLLLLCVAACAIATLGSAAGGCSSFDSADATVLPDAGPAGDAASDDGGDATSATDASAAVDAPFCPHDASFCADFEQMNVNLGWDDIQNPYGTAAWSPLGATRPGALELVGPAAGGPTEVGYLWFRRRLAGLTGSRVRLEAAVRFEMLPDVGYNTVVDLYFGNALFYVYFSQTGWRVDDGYYGTTCGPGPCGGGIHGGFHAPVPLHVWDRIALDLDRNDGGGFSAVFTSSSGERIAFDLQSAYVPGVRVDSYLAAGLAVASPAATDRKVLLDDIALTISP
jgi:hypothetical protein